MSATIPGESATPAAERGARTLGGSWAEWAALAVVLAALAWVCSAWFLGHPFGVAVFDADLVQPFLVARDAQRTPEALRGWMFPEAPFHFPDLVLAWLSLEALGTLKPAILACTFLMALAWLTSACGLVRSVFEPARAWLGTWVFLALNLITFVGGCEFSTDLFRYVFSRTLILYYHGGALICTTACLFLAVRYLGRGGKASLVALTVLVMATSASDRLFVAEATLPLVVSSTALMLWPGGPRRRLAVLVAVSVLATAGGLLLLYPQMQSQSSPGAGVVSFAGSVAQLASDASVLSTRQPLYSLVLVGAPVLLGVIGLIRGFHSRPREGETDETARLHWSRQFVLLSVMLSVFGTLGALLVSGRYDTIKGLRFVQNIALMQVAAAVTLAAWRARVPARAWARWSPPVLALLLCIVVSLWPEGRLRRFLAYTDATARCVSDLDQQQPLNDGLAEYWYGKSTEAFLDPRIRVNQIDSQGRAYTWNTSLDHYLGSGRDIAEIPEYDFIIENGLDAGELDRTFGAPTRRVLCAGAALRVYARPNALTGIVLRASPHLFDLMLARRGRVASPAWAWAQRGFDLRWRSVRVNGEAYLVLDGSLWATRGVSFTLEYRGSGRGGGPAGTWEVGLQASSGPYQPVAQGTLPSATRWTQLRLSTIAPVIDRLNRRARVRVSSTENGALELRQVLAITEREPSPHGVP